MSTPKNAETPKRETTRKANKDRPVKPEFVLIGHNLHYSPDGVKEVVVDVDPEWGLVEPILAQAESDDSTEGEMFTAVLEIIYGAEGAREKIRGLRTSEFFTLVNRWMAEFTKAMGLATPGE